MGPVASLRVLNHLLTAPEKDSRLAPDTICHWGNV